MSKNHRDSLFHFGARTIFTVLGIFLISSFATASGSLRFNNSTKTAKSLSNAVPNQQEQQQPHQQSHRSLSGLINPAQECQINYPEQLRRGKIQPIYFASYPGSGSAIVRTLITSLTGLHIGRIAVQTHYPHKSGMNIDIEGGDNPNPMSQRALVLIRNPLHAIPSLFDHVYELQKHLPVKFQEGYQQSHREDSPSGRSASVEEWISWRDRMWSAQLISFRDFVRYWTSRYNGGNRLLISFENLIEDHGLGTEEAKKLRHFLSKDEWLQTVAEEIVPCIWSAVVKGGIENGGDISFVGDGKSVDDDEVLEEVILEAESAGRRRRRRLNEVTSNAQFMPEREDSGVEGEAYMFRRRLGYYIPHPLQQRRSSGPKKERPYTPQQLDDLAAMLQDLAGEFKESTLLHELLTRYQIEVTEYALSSEDQFGEHQLPQQLPQSQQMQQQEQQLDPSNYAGTTLDGRIFHIFVVSIDNTPESVVATNLLMGLFESSSDLDYAYLVSTPGLYVHQRGVTVPISSTVVTKTQIDDLIGVYKLFKPQFDEVFFVVSNDENDPSKRIDEEICEYDNVLCVGSSRFEYSSKSDLQQMATTFSEEIMIRFSYFFGMGASTAKLNPAQAELRLKEMDQSFRALENEPFKILDMKYGVHGGIRGQKQSVSENGSANPLDHAQFFDPNLPRRLFYCGYSGANENRRDSIYGIILVNTFFPEIEGGAPGNYIGRSLAIRLTEETIKHATPNDFLVYHMHQLCDAEVLLFPGLQLHVNAEYYDIHPQNKMLNPDGLLTTNYIPPQENIYVIGAHEDGPRSIRLPYAMMRWWIMVKGNRAEIDQEEVGYFFDNSKRPKNKGTAFLLYANSHYVDYREAAAHELQKIKPIHVMGKCQGNIDAAPVLMGLKSPQCEPFPADERPKSVKILSKDREQRSNNFVTGQEFRFVLVMENANSPGYISEKIVDSFMSGSIPIYYGTTEIFDIFNRKAFIYYDVEKPNEALNLIKRLEKKPTEYQRMLDEPILADGERTIEKYFSFDDTIGHGMLKRKIRERLGFPV